MASWLEKLQEYDFAVLHRQGPQHTNADALSRIPCRQCGRGDLCGKEVNDMHTVAGVTPCFLQTDNMEEVRRMQAEDNIIGPVLEAIQPGKPPEPDVAKSWSRENCILLHGVLWRRFSEEKKKQLQLVLPSKLHEKVIQDLHEGVVGAHLGEEKVLS